MSQGDLLAERISSILIKLNAGEKCDLNDLAQEFSVNLRTIQRDVNERLAFLPLEREGGLVYLPPTALGRLSISDIRNFAQICGIQELFPSLDNSFLTALLSNTYHSSYLVKGHHYETDPQLSQLLSRVSKSIELRQKIDFIYKEKAYEGVKPYKLINAKGIWYLAGEDRNKVKTFHLTQLHRINERNSTFEIDNDIESLINDEDGIFISEHKFEVVLKTSPRISHYFKRRALLPHQVIDKELESGELIITSLVSDELQIIPLIKYWIPDLEVISPKSILKTIHNQCLDFIEM